ncbi:hypothetical protein LINGRAHAP2_LOCUS29083 [Linum grandiflorum]
MMFLQHALLGLLRFLYLFPSNRPPLFYFQKNHATDHV